MSLFYVDLQPAPPDPPANAALCRMYGRVVDIAGQPVRFTRLEFSIAGVSSFQPALHPQLMISSTQHAVATDENGQFQVDLLRGLPVFWRIYPDAFHREMLVPDLALAPFFDHALPRPILFGWKVTLNELEAEFYATPDWDGDPDTLAVYVPVGANDVLRVQTFALWSNGKATYPGERITKVSDVAVGASAELADGAIAVHVGEGVEPIRAVLSLDTSSLEGIGLNLYEFAGWRKDGVLDLLPSDTFSLTNLPPMFVQVGE